VTRTLARKLGRDMWRLRGLILAAAMVLGAGIALYIMAAGTLASLIATREAYYARQGMADVTALARRVPAHVLPEARGFAGVASVDSRLTGAGLVRLAGVREPVNAIVHSLADGPDPGLNAPFLVRGRWPDPLSGNEALVNEAFARARGLGGGDRLSVVLRGARLDLVITGTAQAPDHVYTVPPGALTADDSRFAVLWLPRRALEGPLDQVGAFNELLIRLEAGASPAATITAVDRLLDAHGGTGAVPLADQPSDRFLTSEMDQLSVMARILPPAFLGVAAFLLWVTVGRLVGTERQQIGLLKAFGYRDVEIGLHYAMVALLTALVGIAIGIVGGQLLGRGATIIYAEFYQFPILLFRSDPAVIARAAAIGCASGLVGVLGPVRQAVALAPAVAMRPPPPPRYGSLRKRPGGRLRRFDPGSRMLLRHLGRFPGRSFAAGLGVALSLALAIGTSFNTDAIARMLHELFDRASRQTATVVFAEVRPATVVHDLARLPGVMAVEPFRGAPARLVNGTRSWRESLTGMAPLPSGAMVRPLDTAGETVPVPAQGLVISQTLAGQLDAQVGTILEVHILDGARPVLPLRVAAVVQTWQGTPAWVDLATLNALLLEGPVISGAWLLVDPNWQDQFVAALADLPMVSAVTLRRSVLASFRTQVAENLGIFRWYSLGLAGVIVVGVIFTNARMALSEQARDLATMRVLGYRPREVGAVLVGGLLLLTLLAIPAGIGLGVLLAKRITSAFSSELYTIPLAISTATIGMAALSTLGAAVVTALYVARRVHRLDLVRTLKAPE
jgi:putative ABC transport system permease protein